MPLSVIAAIAIAQTTPQPTREPRTQIPIITSIDKDMFPESWRKAPISAEATALDTKEADRTLKVILRSMEKYPAGVLKTNLKSVYLSKRIAFYGLVYGGTNSLDAVYVSNDGEVKGFTNEYIQGAFHHEFSSILLRNFGKNLDMKLWKESQPAGFKYRGDGTSSLREGTASTRYEAEYHKQGFLAQYATSSLEEDFNMTAEGLMTGLPSFWKAVDAYPLLKKKATAVMRFYQKLDPVFTEQYFRKLTL